MIFYSVTESRYIFLLIFVLTFSFGQWETINQPGMGNVALMLAEDDELYVATGQAQVYHSGDQSMTWDLLSDTMDTQPYGVDLLFKKDSAVFFVQNVGPGPYNYRSVFGTGGWGAWETLPHQSSALVSMVGNDSLIFTILNGISISSDLGETWTTIPYPPITGYIQLLLADNDYLYVNHGCQLFRTGDLGVNWEDITGILDEEGYTDPYNCSVVMSMAYHGEQLMISMYWGGGLGKLFVSSDAGINWSVLNGFPVEHHVYNMISKNNILYTGTASLVSGVFYTTDLLNWVDISSGLDSYDLSVNQLVATNEYIFKTGSTVNSHRIPLIDIYDWNFSIQNLEINDSSGDGLWEPGETTIISMELCNNSESDHMYYPGVILEADTGLVTIQYPHYWFYGMVAGDCEPLDFSVTASATAPDGAVVDFLAMPTALNCVDLPQYCIEGDTLAFSCVISVPNVAINDPADLSNELSLHQNIPNPFNPVTMVQFELPVESETSLKVLSLNGAQVVSLASGNMQAGSHRATWNGTDVNGKKVPAGVYFLLLTSGETIQTRKIIFLK